MQYIHYTLGNHEHLYIYSIIYSIFVHLCIFTHTHTCKYKHICVAKFDRCSSCWRRRTSSTIYDVPETISHMGSHATISHCGDMAEGECVYVWLCDCTLVSLHGLCQACVFVQLYNLISETGNVQFGDTGKYSTNNNQHTGKFQLINFFKSSECRHGYKCFQAYY